MPQRQDILNELSKFGIRDASQIKLIDSTHDALDIRLNYIIDKKWVIRFCNDEAMTEARLSDLHRLIDRYHALGILCPQFLNDDDPEERRLGLFFGNAIMSKCSEVWVFGDRISSGMAAEIRRARWKNYRLRYFTDDFKEVQDVRD